MLSPLRVPSRTTSIAYAAVMLGFARLKPRSDFYLEGERWVLIPGQISPEKAGTNWKLNRARHSRTAIFTSPVFGRA
jgi:hypothetical protein